MKPIILGVAVAALSIGAVAPATSASANPSIMVKKVTMPQKVQAHIFADGVVDQWVYMGPIAYETTDGKLHIVYCNDVFTDMTLGVKTPPVEMTIGALDTDAIGNPIDSDMARRLTFLHTFSKSAVANERFAGQGAIWVLGGVTVFTHDPVLNALILSLASGGTMANYIAMSYIDGSGVLQGGIGMVPEPATWAMLIAGFGMVGFAARRRRSALAPVLA